MHLENIQNSQTNFMVEFIRMVYIQIDRTTYIISRSVTKRPAGDWKGTDRSILWPVRFNFHLKGTSSIWTQFRSWTQVNRIQLSHPLGKSKSLGVIERPNDNWRRPGTTDRQKLERNAGEASIFRSINKVRPIPHALPILLLASSSSILFTTKRFLEQNLHSFHSNFTFAILHPSGLGDIHWI